MTAVEAILELNSKVTKDEIRSEAKPPLHSQLKSQGYEGNIYKTPDGKTYNLSELTPVEDGWELPTGMFIPREKMGQYVVRSPRIENSVDL